MSGIFSERAFKNIMLNKKIPYFYVKKTKLFERLLFYYYFIRKRERFDQIIKIIKSRSKK